MRYAIVLLLLIIPCTLGVNIRGGEIYLVRPDSPYIDHAYVPPEYLSVEDLVFYTCIEEKGIPVKSTVICLDDNSFKDVDVIRWIDDENCYMSTYDLDEKDCGQILIQSEYLKDEEVVTLQQEIKVNRLSSILDLVTRNQYSDGGWKDSVHTASGVWVLSNYPEIYDDELALGMDWLKLNRDNTDKCWPKEDCSVRTTAKILAYLTQAGFNSSYRIIHDGLVYLKHQHNFYLEDDLWNLSMSPYSTGNTSCVISYQEVINEDNFSMEYGSISNYQIEPAPGEKLYVICDGNFKANLTAVANEQVFIYEGDNLSYTIPNNCWSNDLKWGECDLMTTLFATMTNISERNRELALDYLAEELIVERSGEKSLGRLDNQSSLYTYLADDPNVTSWVRYRQNNDGSWGNNTGMDNVIPTGYGLLGLLGSGFNRTNEVIEDAEEWVNEREIEFTLNVTKDYTAWNSTEKNALAFIVLKNNARPVIKSDPQLVIIDKQETEIEIFNPTTFDYREITFGFSENLEEILTIDEEDYIPSYSYVKQTITKGAGETGNIYGHLFVYNFDYELAKIPIIISNFPRIEVQSSETKLIVFGTGAQATFNVDKSAHSFDCTLDWDDDDISSQQDHKISSAQITVDLTFAGAERLEKTYTGEFVCTSGDYTFDLPISLPVSRYSSFPFSVEPIDIFVNTSRSDANFVIKNLLDETLDVNLKFLKTSQYFELSRDAIAIDPNTQANITIINSVDANMNLSAPNIIEVSALGQKKEIEFRATIVATPETLTSPLVMWSLLIFLVVVLGVGGYFSYKYKDFIMNFIRKGNKIDQIKIKIKKLEEKEKNTAITNMISILRILKKDDVQIRGRLKQEGFSEEEINKALASEEQDEPEEEATEDDLF